MSARDTFLLLGFVMMAFGAVLGTWALLTGPLGKITGLGPDEKKTEKKTEKKPRAKRVREDDPGS